jgi:hypothetical protein
MGWAAALGPTVGRIARRGSAVHESEHGIVALAFRKTIEFISVDEHGGGKCRYLTNTRRDFPDIVISCATACALDAAQGREIAGGDSRRRDAIMCAAQAEADRLTQKHAGLISALADVLVDRRRLSGQEIADVLRSLPRGRELLGEKPSMTEIKTGAGNSSAEDQRVARVRMLRELCAEDGFDPQTDFSLWLRWRFLEVGPAPRH